MVSFDSQKAHWGFAVGITSCRSFDPSRSYSGQSAWASGQSYVMPYDLSDGDYFSETAADIPDSQALIFPPEVGSAWLLVISRDFSSALPYYPYLEYYASGPATSRSFLSGVFGDGWGLFGLTPAVNPDLVSNVYRLVLSSFRHIAQLVFVPSLIPLPYNYEISSNKELSLGYSDQTTLSGLVVRLKTKAPEYNLSYSYSVDATTASALWDAMRLLSTREDAYEVVFDPVSRSLAFIPVKGSGPALSQRDVNVFSFDVRGRG